MHLKHITRGHLHPLELSLPMREWALLGWLRMYRKPLPGLCGHTHSPWPCTRGSASLAGAARCHTSCHTPCTWHSRAGFLPATGVAWRSANHRDMHTRDVPRAPHTGEEALTRKCSEINSTKTSSLTQAGRGQGLQRAPPHLTPAAGGHSTTHRGWPG